MAKSGLTIHKEIQKKEYSESPVGKLERELTKFYDDMRLHQKALPEVYAEEIYNIRDEHEKKHLDYIDETLRRDKKAVEGMLFDAMTKELEVINKYKKSNES